MPTRSLAFGSKALTFPKWYPSPFPVHSRPAAHSSATLSHLRSSKGILFSRFGSGSPQTYKFKPKLQIEILRRQVLTQSFILPWGDCNSSPGSGLLHELICTKSLHCPQWVTLWGRGIESLSLPHFSTTNLSEDSTYCRGRPLWFHYGSWGLVGRNCLRRVWRSAFSWQIAVPCVE